MQPVCEYADMSRLDVMCISRLDSYTHTVYEMMNDDESLDQIFLQKSRTDLDETRKTYNENCICLDQIFMCGYGEISALWVDNSPF